MNGRPVFAKSRAQNRTSSPIVLDIAELTLEVPRSSPPRKPEGPVVRNRKSEDKLVPDKGPSGDLVPDCWGGIDLA